MVSEERVERNGLLLKEITFVFGHFECITHGFQNEGKSKEREKFLTKDGIGRNLREDLDQQV